MSRLSPQFLDELRGRSLLSALVGHSVKLQRAGREWRACCPFHHEKSPSFYVNDDKGFYHCFGCSAHGDAIRWLTEARGLSFIDAVKELADSAGLALPAPDPAAAARAERALGLHDVMGAAGQWFAAQMSDEARAYCSKRRLTDATIAEFGIGYAPDRRDALKTALARFGDALLIEAGLLIQVEDKAPYDRFRGRLMIPIHDARGRVIAFGGRVIGEGEPKYLNSPETPLFDKGRTLFNLHRASVAARAAKRVIVVEGYLDVIALAQAGIGEAVAPLGTALTEAQLDRLWRIADVPILCFDGDAAGRKAAIRAAERALPLLTPGRSLDFVMLPQGQDPDDLVRDGGRAALDAAVEARVTLVDLLWQHQLDARPLKTPEARAGLKARLAEAIAIIADAEIRRHYAAAWKERFDTLFFARTPQTARSVAWKGNRFQPAPLPPGTRVQRIGAQAIDTLYARPIMAGLIRHRTMVATCAEPLAMLAFADPQLDRLRTLLLAQAYRAPPVDSNADDPISQAGLAPLVAALERADGLAFSFTRGDAPLELARKELAMVIEALATRPEIEAALAAATERLMEEMDDERLAEQSGLIAAKAAADRMLQALTEREEI